MATYAETKREAIGVDLSPAIPPLTGDSAFNVPLNMGQMEAHGHIVNFDMLLKEQIDEQMKLKIVLEMRWDAEYAVDRKAARKNFVKLGEYLLAGDTNKTAQLLTRNPAADWLNHVFLDKAEIDALTDLLKKTSPECRAAVAAAAGKEVERLVNFKALLEQLLKEISQG